MNLIQAVAFDMDGLMFNTEDVYWKAADTLLRRRGYSYTEALCARIMGRPPRYCFETFIEVFHLPESWQSLAAESEEIFLSILNDGFDAMPGLYELLDRIEQARLPKAVCTSSAKKILEAVLGGANLLNRFDFFLTAESIQEGKPAPEIYLKAAEQFNLPPSRMLVLEDSPAGCLAAKNAGAYCYAIRAEHNKNADLSAAVKILPSLSHVFLT